MNIGFNFSTRIVENFEFTKEELETMYGVEIVEKEILKSKHPRGKNKNAQVDQKTKIEYPEITF